MTGGWAITAFVIAIIVAIMVHELGHFLTAKWFGMKADRYFLGFGPTLWSTRRGETEYGVKALPLGGFVRICGMSPVDERRPSLMDAVFPGTGELTEESFVALDRELKDRGTPPDRAEHILRRTRATLQAAPVVSSGQAVPDSSDARDVLREVVLTEVEETGRHGDLRHRLLHGDEGRFFTDRPAWQRAIVLAAGSAMHFVMAILVLFAAYALLPQWTGDIEPVVSSVQAASPADEAGLEPGDRLLAVDGVRSDQYDVLTDVIRDRPGQVTEFVIDRGAEERSITITPRSVEDPETGESIGQVGFTPSREEVRVGPVDALEQALVGDPGPGTPGGFVPMFTGSISALTSVFSPSGLADIFQQATGQEERGVEGAVSLVGAASLAGQVSGGALGLILFAGLFAAVNVFIGIFNLVPLPPLDGGHLAVLGIERSVNAARRLRGKPADYTVDPRAFAAVAIPVIGVLLVFMVLLLWLDITDPIRL
jgi:membrane-associated protease RseP (regulator of RpoE activity)